MEMRAYVEIVTMYNILSLTAVIYISSRVKEENTSVKIHYLFFNIMHFLFIFYYFWLAHIVIDVSLLFY